MTDHPQPKLNGFAVAGIVCSIPLALLGIIFSAIGLSQINRSNGTQSGRGLAIAGLVISILVGVLGMLAAIAIPSFLDYMHKSKSSEAKLQLNHLGRAAKAFYIEHDAFPTSSAPLTPATPCCASPGGRCMATTEWQTPGWTELDYQTYGPTRFQYSYTSTPKMFEALAVGDPSCDGALVTYRLVVDASNGFPEERIEEPRHGN